MPTSEERALENAIIADLEALTYITAQSIPVRNADDQTDARAFPCVSVTVSPRSRIAPNASYYRLGVVVVCSRHRGDDPTQAVFDLLVNEVVDWSNAIDAIADYSADGINYGEPIDDYEESFHHRGVSFDIFKTIA